MRSRPLLLATLVLVVASTSFPGGASPPPTLDGNEGPLLAIAALTHDRPSVNRSEATPNSNATVVSRNQSNPNPWGTRTVTVGVRRVGGPVTRAHVEAVRSAAAYWNDRATKLTPYRVVFVVEPAAKRVDVLVRFVPYIEQCGAGNGSITIGCAPQYERGGSANVPTVVRIREGRPTDSLADTIQHEFGHLLGLEHGEGPMPLMDDRTEPSTPTALRNASDRAYPWHEAVLTVAVAAHRGYDPAALRAHVAEALAYYQHISARWPARTVSFRLVETSRSADIVLRFTPANACDIGDGYCWSIFGENLDRDPAIEYYTGFEATFAGLQERYASWYAGRMVGYALGAENESQLPDVFEDPEHAGNRWLDPEAAAQRDDEGAADDGPTTPHMP
ncbi:MAG: hypothetical protein ABEJ27_00555 [Halodesulfurarchaeum sp.]